MVVVETNGITMNDEDQMILDNIDEYVNDEGKVVSYKWISLLLSINVNKAKELLEEYLKRSENELDVVYFIGGRINGEPYSGLQYRLTKQKDLERVKSEYDEVTTCHIYSIQKSCIKDPSTLYASHVDMMKEYLPQINKCSAIQCDLVENFNETLAKRTSQQGGPPPVVVNDFYNDDNIEKEHSKSSNDIVAKKNDVFNNKKEKQPVGSKKGASNSSLRKEATAKSFFGNAKPVTVKTDGADNSSEDKISSKNTNSDAKKDTEKKKKVEKKDISAAFGKSKNETRDSKKVESSIEPDILDKKEEKIIEEKKESHHVEKSKIKQKKEKTRKSNEIEKPVSPEVKKEKKRKALVVDSESDDDFEKFLSKSKDPTYKSPEKKSLEPKSDSTDKLDEDVDIIEPSPEVVKKKKRRKVEKDENKTDKKKDKKKKTDDETKEKKIIEVKDVDSDKEPKQPGEKRRGRRMVMKSKQYLDDEGFMVTKKEYESESFSEESETEMSEEKIKTLSPEKKKVVVEKKIVKDLEQKTKAHLKKPKKQVSMMNFFKKN